MPFTIVKDNIVRMDVDAIVNAANTMLLMGGGVCGAIFRAAGIEDMERACSPLAPINTGEAVVTPGFKLKAKYVIHTAGPIYNPRDPEVCEYHLRSSYTESLKRAEEMGCESIAFPLISSGIYGYPKIEALKTATDAIRDFLKDHDISVFLVIYDRDSFFIRKDLSQSIERYLDGNYIGHDSLYEIRRRECEIESGSFSRRVERDSPFRYQERNSTLDTLNRLQSLETSDLKSMLGRINSSFHECLFSYIKEKNMNDSTVYKRANIDRKLFSKIRREEDYNPSKRTIVALAIALELTLDETNNLLEKAGYTLSHSQKFDVIIEYFIINRKYDIFEINEVLFKYDQALLGSF